MVEGRIIKGIGGFYTVNTPQGDIICKARGLFRKQGLKPLPGDNVIVRLLPDGSGYLEELKPRKNEFDRPPVCNIDTLCIIASESTPVTDPFMIDRMSVIALSRGVEVIIAINKCDLSDESRLADIYAKTGLHTVKTSALTGYGIDELEQYLGGKLVAFTGNSGVGKSALLGKLDPTRVYLTGEVSDRLGRGRHTTRHVEFYALDKGILIADTPGFAALETAKPVSKETLPQYFPEFTPYLTKCRYIGCSHEGSEGCAIYAAVNADEIHYSRYQSYLQLLMEAKEWTPWKNA